MDLLFVGIFSFVAICVATTGGRPNDTLNGRISRADPDPLHSSQSKHTHGRVFKRSSGPSTVYIASYIYDLTQTRPITVSVDSTMTKLIFKVEVNSGNPVIMATNPQGMPTRPKLNGTVSTVEGPVAPADYGQKWTFMRLDRNIWDVTIMAESTVDFTYELIDVSTGAVWNEYPIQGKQYKIQITVPNFSLLKMVAMAMLFVKESSMAKDMSPLSNKGGGQYEFTYTMKNTSFMIGIDGMDTAMHPVRRLCPNPITPVNLKLIVPPYTGAMLYEGQQFTIDITVTSFASVEQDLDIRIVDDKNFAQAPVFLSPTIKPGENWTGQFILKGGPMGETTNVTITARPYLGHGQFGNGPSEIRQFTVYTNLTTTTTTTTTTTASTTTASTTSPSTATTTSTITTSTTTASTTATSTATSSTATTTPTPTTTKLSTTKTPSSSAAPTSSSVASSQSSSSLPTSKTSVSTSTPAIQTSPQKPTSGSSTISSAVAVSSSTTGGSGAVSAAVQSASGSTTKPPPSSSTKAQTAQALQSASVTNLPPAGISNVITQPPSQASSASAGATQPPATVAVAVATGSVKTVSGSSQSAKSGQGATESPSSDNEFNKGDVLIAAIVSGVSGGTLVGVVGLVVMALLFRGAMKKAQPNKVKPQTQESERVRTDSFRRKHVGDHNLAWT